MAQASWLWLNALQAIGHSKRVKNIENAPEDLQPFSIQSAKLTAYPVRWFASVKIPQQSHIHQLWDGKFYENIRVSGGDLASQIAIQALLSVVDKDEIIISRAQEEQIWTAFKLDPGLSQFIERYDRVSARGVQNMLLGGYQCPFALNYSPSRITLNTTSWYDFDTDIQKKKMFLQGTIDFNRDLSIRSVRRHNSSRELDLTDRLVLHEINATLFAHQTGFVHLSFLHYVLSGQITTMSMKHLPAQHPLRRLLQPTEYGVIPVVTASVQNLLTPTGVPCFLPYTLTGAENLFNLLDRTDIHAKLVQQIILDPLRYNPGLPILNDAQAWYTEIRDFCANFVLHEVDTDDVHCRRWYTALRHLHPRRNTLSRTQVIVDLCTWSYYGNIIHETLSTKRNLQGTNVFDGVVGIRNRCDGSVPMYSFVRQITVASATRYEGISMAQLPTLYLPLIETKYHSYFTTFVERLRSMKLSLPIFDPRVVEVSCGW